MTSAALRTVFLVLACAFTRTPAIAQPSTEQPAVAVPDGCTGNYVIGS